MESAQHALAIVLNEYKVGTTDYQNVLSAQTTAFLAQQKLANIAGERMVSSVGLVKALGGGWSVAQMDRETGDMAAPAPVPSTLPASGAQGQGQSGAAAGKAEPSVSATTAAAGVQ